MAFYFTSTPVEGGNKRLKWGDKSVIYGEWDTNGYGGNIDTNLRVCEGMILTNSGGALVPTAAVVTSALPTEGDSITIATSLNTNGIWFAYGR